MATPPPENKYFAHLTLVGALPMVRSAVQETRSTMQVEIQERWRELCEKAIAEQDAEKFLAIITELNQVLAEKQQLLTPPPPKPHCSAA